MKTHSSRIWETITIQIILQGLSWYSWHWETIGLSILEQMTKQSSKQRKTCFFDGAFQSFPSFKETARQMRLWKCWARWKKKKSNVTKNKFYLLSIKNKKIEEKQNYLEENVISNFAKKEKKNLRNNKKKKGKKNSKQKRSFTDSSRKKRIRQRKGRK